VSRDAHRDADLDVVLEGIPRDQEVGVGFEPGADGARVEHRLQPAARHDAARRQREVGLALDDDQARHLPVEAETGHRREAAGGLEGGVIAAQCEQELGLSEPHEERETAGQLAVRVEEPGVVCELGLDREQAFRTAEARLERELDADQGQVGDRERHPAHAQQPHLDPAVEFDVDDRGGRDEREGAEPETGSQPEAPPARGHGAAHLDERRHRVVGQAVVVDRGDQQEVLDVADVVRDVKLPIHTDPATQAQDEQERRAPERDVHGHEDEERGVIGRPRIGTDHRDPADAGQVGGQHPVVFERGAIVLQESAGDADPRRLQCRGEPAQVETPGVRVEEGLEGDVDAQVDDVDLEGGHLEPTDQQHGHVGAGVVHLEIDLFDVEWTEGLVDRDRDLAAALDQELDDAAAVVDGHADRRVDRLAVAGR